MSAFTQFILPAMIAAGGQLGAGFMGGGKSMSQAKRLMYHQQLYWVDRFRAQTAQQRRFMRDYGPGWQFGNQFNEKMKMADKYGINKLAMLRGSGGMMSPPTAIGSQPSAGAGIPDRDNSMSQALVGMSQTLAGLVAQLAKQASTPKDRGDYDYIRITPTAEQGMAIEKPVAASQATMDAMGRIKVIPSEILGEAYDASPFQKIKGFFEELGDTFKTRFVWKRGYRADRSEHVRKLWRVKEWLHQYLKVPETHDIRISGDSGTWYKVKSKQRKLWLYKSPKNPLQKYSP